MNDKCGLPSVTNQGPCNRVKGHQGICLVFDYSVKDPEDLVYRLLKRAEIRRMIVDRKSVQEGKPDRIADLLEEAAKEIETLRENLKLSS
jgi:hypothetical protein